MKMHALFPVTVCEFNYPNAAEFKQNLSDGIFKHLDEDGISNEMTGHVTLHHEPEYRDLFCFLQTCVEEYLKALNVKADNFNINFIKSWFNIIKHTNTPLHSHSDSHISISYYANVPENCTQAIKFNNYHNRMEPFPGCIRWNNPEEEWTVLNSYSWQFVPKEGDVFIFPAKLKHSTVGAISDNTLDDTIDRRIKTIDDFYDHRICLAADVLLTYKNKQPLPLGIQPVENWRTFK